MKRQAYRIHARCILNGCDYRMTLWLKAAQDANAAVKRHVRRHDRNSMRIIEVRLATAEETPKGRGAQC